MYRVYGVAGCLGLGFLGKCYSHVQHMAKGYSPQYFHLGSIGLVGWGRLYGEFGHLPHRAPDRIDEPLVVRGGQAAERLGLLKNGVVHRRVHEGHLLAAEVSFSAFWDSILTLRQNAQTLNGFVAFG